MSQQDIIFLQNLQVDITIGVHRWEQQITQAVLLDLELGCDLTQAAKKDKLTATIDYQQIADYIIEISENQHFQLLETFADTILTQLLKNFPKINFIKIKIAKPHAVKQAQYVGVIMERYRD